MSSTTTKTETSLFTTPAEDARRIAEIQAEFAPVARAVKEWHAVPGIVPAPVELLNSLMPKMALKLLSDGPVPQALAAAWASLNLWAVVLVRVLKSDNEFVDSAGMPRLTFWGRFNDFMHALDVKPPVRRVLPRLATLMEDFSGDLRRDTHIAREFSRYDKELGINVGPFFRNGSVDSAAIQRELRDPGSVLTPEFDPEAGRVVELVEMEPANSGALTELHRYLEESGQKKQEFIIDPASVEELLLQQMFPGTIARVKNIPEKQVRRIAAELGIKCTEASDLYEMAEILSPEDQIYRRAMLGDHLGMNKPVAVEPAMDEDDTDEDTDFESGLDDESDSEAESESDVYEDSEDETPELSVDSVLQALLESNPDVDTPKAMQALKASGLTATGREVGAKLSELKQAMTAAAGG